ncbi:tetratricopeptide repeat protein [Planococcus sp. ISL-109]|uniref:tetratricopeptide repeat protein n=1 Tax=Planococcus sp. ISL-109 TaxID=2819166 RepID=UPI001BECCC3F|nr:tetratricopeptide repeat protein [Planococcus sp. ISL-109]MBT2582382.1 tetratricopeptide repeat protein [Planococcus sp. ISL-109]
MNYNEIGIKALQEGRAEDAIQAFTQAIEQHPEDALGYINFGHVLTSMSETDRAERFFQKALTLDEQSATAFYGLANLYFNAERYEEALKLYEQAVQNGIEGSDAHYMIGKCFERIDQPKLALPYLQRAVELDGKDVLSRLSYGIALASLELFEMAEQQFVCALELDVDNSDVHYNLGVLYAVSSDRTEDAMYHLQRAYKLDENNEMARYAYDMINERLK